METSKATQTKPWRAGSKHLLHTTAQRPVSSLSLSFHICTTGTHYFCKYPMPSTVLGVDDTIQHDQDKSPTLVELGFWRQNKQENHNMMCCDIRNDDKAR
jgi:hypothetical protein